MVDGEVVEYRPKVQVHPHMHASNHVQEEERTD